jgi:hypothetical protein
MQNVLHGYSEAGAEVSILPSFSESLVVALFSSGICCLFCVFASCRYDGFHRRRV